MHPHYLKLVFLGIVATIFSSCDTTGNERMFSGSHSSDSLSSDSVVISKKSFSIRHREGEEIVFDYPFIQTIESGKSERMNTAIRDIGITEYSKSEIEKVYNECKCGMVGSSYQVNYNNHSILSLSVIIKTMAASPGVHRRNLNFDLLTGKALDVKDILLSDSIPKVVQLLNPLLGDHMDEAKKRADDQEGEDGDGGDNLIEELEDGAAFTRDNLTDFILTKEGVLFYYNFAFPDEAKAIEPSNEFLLTYEQLSNYLKDRRLVEKYRSSTKNKPGA